MSEKPSNKTIENVLLILYHRNGFFRKANWELGSALKTLRVDCSEAVTSAVAEEFLKRGWATFTHIRKNDVVLRPSHLTDEGQRAAIRILQERHFTGPLDRLHRLNWNTWGAIAALASALFAAIAAFPVIKQLFD